MTETRPQAFWTMHGLGNKIVVLDLRDSAHIVSGPEAAAHRPANALLDCGTLGAVFGVRMPDWKSGVRSCVMQILAETAPQ
jgi:dTDP-4-dehydrorhamnose reductase